MIKDQGEDGEEMGALSKERHVPSRAILAKTTFVLPRSCLPRMRPTLFEVRLGDDRHG